jgi:hypothetical protein
MSKLLLISHLLLQNKSVRASAPNFPNSLAKQTQDAWLALGKPTHPLVFPMKVPFWCLYTTKLAPISKINNGAFRWANSPTREYARPLAKQESGNAQSVPHTTANYSGG